MILPKWKKEDLIMMEEDGYRIIKCDDEPHALKVKRSLKEQRKCVQSGYVLNKDNERVYFCITRERNKPVRNS